MRTSTESHKQTGLDKKTATKLISATTLTKPASSNDIWNELNLSIWECKRNVQFTCDFVALPTCRRYDLNSQMNSHVPNDSDNEVVANHLCDWWFATVLSLLPSATTLDSNVGLEHIQSLYILINIQMWYVRHDVSKHTVAHLRTTRSEESRGGVTWRNSNVTLFWYWVVYDFTTVWRQLLSNTTTGVSNGMQSQWHLQGRCKIYGIGTYYRWLMNKYSIWWSFAFITRPHCRSRHSVQLLYFVNTPQNRW